VVPVEATVVVDPALAVVVDPAAVVVVASEAVVVGATVVVVVLELPQPAATTTKARSRTASNANPQNLMPRTLHMNRPSNQIKETSAL